MTCARCSCAACVWSRSRFLPGQVVRFGQQVLKDDWTVLALENAEGVVTIRNNVTGEVGSTRAENLVVKS